MKKQLLITLAVFALAFTTYAQPGAIDLTFNPGTGANSSVLTTSIQSDGQLIIGGVFTSYNGTDRSKIARLNVDGTLDETFNPGTGANNVIWTISIQSDGKIIIGGQFTSYNGTARSRIARLNVDGTLDETFNPGTGANSNVSTTSIQSDGKIIIGGVFTTYNETEINYIARLNVDGTLDGSFNPGIGADSPVLTTSIQSDGKIIIGGGFTSYNGTERRKIARLNVDGSLDTSFFPGTGANSNVRIIAIQSDGQLIIGGDFNFYNGTVRNRIARLNADGTLDPSFNPGTGADWIVLTYSFQSNGQIIIGGYFTSYNETERNYIARLNTDGTLDGTFNPGTGADQPVFTTSIQSDGKLIIGGDFTSYNGTERIRIARINGGVLATPVFEKDALVIYPNPNKGVFNIQTNDTSGAKSIVVYTLLGQRIYSKAITAIETTIDISGQPKGVYMYKVSGENNEVKSGKLVIE